MAGWIKLHRDLLKWEWFGKPEMVHFFIFLLLKANTEDRQWQGRIIKRGSFVTSIRNLAIDSGLSVQSVRTCIKRLKSTHEITHESTHEISIITICNYDKYQVDDSVINTDCNTETNTQPTQHQHTTNTSIRNKEYNNTNDIDKSISMSSDDDAPDSISKKDIEEFMNFFNAQCDQNDSAISRILCIENRRLAMLKARWKQKGRDAVFLVAEKAAKSNYLNGGGKDGWIASIDWILKPNNFSKVLEGNYDNKDIPARFGQPPPQHHSSNLQNNMSFMEMFKN